MRVEERRERHGEELGDFGRVEDRREGVVRDEQDDAGVSAEAGPPP